ncbi:MAG: minor capsid protein [Sutterella sp.]|jgi:SPP1 gp7 family putative phage head morphogenesis protein|uniref:Minor capsid component n=1 Tax=Myoviridae sp. ctakU3 TaxID=2825135 RepID=A0A8S5P0I7_9CAUD|nr:MAG TPA: Minor capsid component [Myoviridae sp. ctakU3]
MRKIRRKPFKEDRYLQRTIRWYEGQLFSVVDVIRDAIEQLASEGGNFNRLKSFYSRMDVLEGDLTDWALDVSKRMLTRASESDLREWRKHGKKLNRAVADKLREAGTGKVFDTLQEEQERLIKTLPSFAAEKVHVWAQEAMRKGVRFEDFVEDIRTHWKDIGEYKARRIARTECARARANFTEARARAVGSEGYIWQTSGDGRVRGMHAHLNGTFHKWDEPPICDIGKNGKAIRAHPGTVFNCRCTASPLFPESMFDDGRGE